MLEPMEILSVNAALLKAQFPELVLRPGTTLVARVLERTGQQGFISLAGARLAAELPEDVQSGQTLRLAVQDVSPDRLVLKLLPDPASMPPAVPIPLPGGAQATIYVREREGEGRSERGHPSVALDYESPELGTLALSLELDPAAVVVRVGVAEGPALALARKESEGLRQALEAAVGRPARVRIEPRRDPFDAYA
jgi:hypothetical protein